MVTKRGLVVEDDLPQAKTVKKVLERLGLEVVVSASVRRARSLIDKYHFAVGVVDRVLPDGDGLELIEYAHLKQYAMRTVVLSGLVTPRHRVQGLEKGASDYLTKPFSYKELELRLHNVYLVDKRIAESTFSYRNVTFYPTTGQLTVRDRNVQLRPREAALFACLIKRPHHTVSRETLIDYVWDGEPTVPDYRTVDTYLSRLRQALKSSGSLIKTVRGFGFKLE